MKKEKIIGIVGGVGPYAEIPLAFPETKIGSTILIDPTKILARALIRAANPNKLRME